MKKLFGDLQQPHDGFFFMDSVPYGIYRMRISKEQMKRLNLKSSFVNVVEINRHHRELQLNFSIVPRSVPIVKSKEVKNSESKKIKKKKVKSKKRSGRRG